MSTKFNAKRFPIECMEPAVMLVDDLVRIDQTGPTLRLLFATVRSEHYGDDVWKKVRSVVLELAIPAELRQQLARELLNFRDGETEATVTIDGDNVVRLH